MRLIALSTILTLLLIGCGDDSASGETGGSDEFTATLSHTYDPIDVAMSEELVDLCQTWVLGNDEPIYVHKVRQANDGGWHHSNWFFVPEDLYEPTEAEGPDATVEGTWNCRDRGFGEAKSAVFGGVFFAQSTQALTEIQAFPQGAAYEIPPHSAIVGSVHLLNIFAGPITSAMTFDVETVPADDVDTLLGIYNFAISDLKIPAAVDGVPTETRTAMTCDLRPEFQRLLEKDVVDYNIYYVLGHYHKWGNFFNLSFVQEDGTRNTVFEIKNRIGEPIGSIIDPPMNSNGAPMLRSECGFINNTDETLTRGLQYGEMCDFLAYTDSGLTIGAGGGSNDGIPDDEVDGIPVHELDCGDLLAIKTYVD
jgi:hypothetical protein